MNKAPPLCCGAMLIVLGIQAAHALPGSPSERAEVFAICSGRLSAMATRQRALHHPDAHATDRIRADFDMLLEATWPAARDYGVPEQMSVLWRSGGWREAAFLMADIQYSGDAYRVAQAEKGLTQRLEACRQLILP